MSLLEKYDRTKKRNEDIPADQILWDIPTAKEQLHASRYTLMKLGTDAGAIIRIGDRVYFSVEKLRRYINLIAG